MKRARLLTLLLSGGTALFLLAARPAAAAILTVTNLNDSGAGSLRDALAAAEMTAAEDTIQFTAGLTGTITLTSGEMVITRNLEVKGPGADLLMVSGNDASPIFKIDGGTVSISGLTLTMGATVEGCESIPVP